MRRIAFPLLALVVLSTACTSFKRAIGNCPPCPEPVVNTETKPCPEPAEPRSDEAKPCKPVPCTPTACKPVPCAPVPCAPVAEAPKPEPAREEPSPSAAACNPGHALVNATLWVQTAAEFRATTIQTFAAAKVALDRALADPAWVAATEEKSSILPQPPAVIVDIDETVIDNTRFQARVIQEGKTYDGEMWEQWTGESGAPAIPGAAEFLSYARDRKVKIFYISNRTIEEEQETLENLRRLGYPVDNDPDTLLMRSERTAWSSSDKSGRREYAAGSHRILLIIGDDLNDFADARERSITERDEIVARTRSWWGTKWFMIPNPMYGSWERAATGGTGTPCEQLRKKVDALRQ